MMTKRDPCIAALMALLALVSGCGLGSKGHPTSTLLDQKEVHEADGGDTLLVVYLADRSTPEQEVKAEAEEMARGFLKGREAVLVALVYDEKVVPTVIPAGIAELPLDKMQAAVMRGMVNVVFSGGGFLVHQAGADPQWVVWTRPPREGEGFAFPGFTS